MFTLTSSDETSAYKNLIKAGNIFVRTALNSWVLSALTGWGMESVKAGAASLGQEFRVNAWTTDDQHIPAIAGLSTGDFVVVWSSGCINFTITCGQDSSGFGIYGQRYASTGTALGSEFRVNTRTTDDQWRPAIAGLSTGDFVVVWQSASQDGSSFGVYGQRYAGTGAIQGSEFRVNTWTTNDQSFPAIAGLSTGDFVVVWQSAS